VREKSYRPCSSGGTGSRSAQILRIPLHRNNARLSIASPSQQCASVDLRLQTTGPNFFLPFVFLAQMKRIYSIAGEEHNQAHARSIYGALIMERHERFPPTFILHQIRAVRRAVSFFG